MAIAGAAAAALRREHRHAGQEVVGRAEVAQLRGARDAPEELRGVLQAVPLDDEALEAGEGGHVRQRRELVAGEVKALQPRQRAELGDGLARESVVREVQRCEAGEGARREVARAVVPQRVALEAHLLHRGQRAEAAEREALVPRGVEVAEAREVGEILLDRLLQAHLAELGALRVGR